MKKILCLLLGLSSVMVAQSPKAYIDISPMWMSYESNGISSDFNPTGFKWTGGYRLKDFSFVSFAIEGSAILGGNSDKKSTVTNSSGVTFTNAEVSLDKMYALHLKSIVPIVQNFNANLYLGATTGKLLSSSDQSQSNSSFENSFSYGAGLEYWTGANVSLYANYMQYFKNLNAVEVGVGFRF